MTKYINKVIQTDIGDLKNQLNKLQETTNANIERLQNTLQKVSSNGFGELPYREQYDLFQSLADQGADLKEYFRDISSVASEKTFNIFLKTRFDLRDQSHLETLADIQEHMLAQTPAKDIPFRIFKSMIASQDVPLDYRNKLIRDRGDKRFKEVA